MSFIAVVSERDDGDFDVLAAFSEDVIDQDEEDTPEGEERLASDFAEGFVEHWGQTMGEQLYVVPHLATVPSVLEGSKPIVDSINLHNGDLLKRRKENKRG